MAASAWVVYNKAKKKIGNSTLTLAATTYRMTLHTSASNAATLTLSTYSQLTVGSDGSQRVLLERQGADE